MVAPSGSESWVKMSRIRPMKPFTAAFFPEVAVFNRSSLRSAFIRTPAIRCSEKAFSSASTQKLDLPSPTMVRSIPISSSPRSCSRRLSLGVRPR